ncbi:hypothetical protein MADA3029_940233 [Vibrio nigripulchritudo MADA3029]|uniref:VTT domain-containing protein n=1 Tax=Vibrio nigripulchritudo SOn1 TaxID=1238450 RepID=A0AAV2VW27_9VIBR|nr:VTT domain-containing protein [Vibrio nigripulchritudo]CCN50559.1 hypothetical protein VIBNIMADA3020_910229 [Vibrio nigripulchritudo MADA3020]CCN52511.1 hypothetical protein VIBNIMADA3021_1230230 [Vibrio nigripulchritudo MADA3021]CCN62339.1 hypothetical protein MADA3029_940233 [Vibrio nigripulchritudo MADA3029]CCO48573.1 hypothetical protein VIBNISOn1_560109 [Vibrio nigripulchritudo SOn1]
MKALIRIMLVVALAFASTFIILKVAGVLSVEQIEGWLTYAQSLSPIYVGGTTVLLLFADLFVAMPTLTITILSGFFLGQWYGAVAAILGMMLAGTIGYLLGNRFGDRLLNVLIKDTKQIEEAKSAFKKHGFVMILLSRAVPILPEVTACLAGMTGMKFSRFIVAWSISTIPYCLIAVYSGSISSLDDPKPAIITAVLMTSGLWLGWYMFRRFKLKRSVI